MQTWAARRAIARLDGSFDGRVEFESIEFQPFNTLVINNIALIDNNPCDNGYAVPQDTIFRAGSINARFTLKGLLSKHGIQLGRAEIRDARLAVVTEPGPEYKSNINRVFHLKPSGKKSDKELFSIRKVRLEDFNFILTSQKPSRLKYSGYGIVWNDLDLRADVDGRRLKMAGGIMSGIADRISLSEKSGYTASRLSGSARVGRGRTELKDLRLTDPWSDVLLPEFNLYYAGTKSFSKFVDEVTIDAELGRSRLAFKTLSYFAPFLKDNSIVADITSGEVYGPVSDLRVSGFEFADRTSGVSARADVSISGLPDVAAMKLDCSLRDFDFTAEGLGTFLSQWSSGRPLDFGGIAKGESFRFNGKAAGTLAGLDVNGDVASAAGSAKARLRISDIIGGKPVRIGGDVSTSDIDLSRIIDQDIVRRCSLKTSLKATLTKGSPSVQIDTLSISRLNILGYDYSNILAAGKFSDKSFDGRIVCNDPNVNFMFQGLANLSRNTDNARYRFYAYLPYADLHALNIDSREVSRISIGSVNADYTRVAKGDMRGTVDATGLVLEGVDGRHNIGDLHMVSRSGDGSHNIRLESDFVEGRYSGTQNPGTMLQDLKEITVVKELDALFADSPRKWSGDEYRIECMFHDSRDLLSFIAPGAYIADSTSVGLRISDTGRLTGRVRSPRLAYKGKYVKGLSLDLDNDDNALNCTVSGGEISLSPAIRLLNNALLLYANDNNVGVGFNFDNGSESESRGEFYVTGDLSGSKPGDMVLNAKTLTSNLFYNGEQWRFAPAEYTYTDGDFRVNGLRIANGDQAVEVLGGFSKTKSDTLHVNLSEVSLAIADSFIPKELDLQGFASGRVMLVSPTKDNFGLFVNIASEETSLAGHPAGTVTVASSWDDASGSLGFALSNSLDGKSTFTADGGYTPDGGNLRLAASLDGMDVGYASPFLTSVFSQMEGRISGHIKASGPPDRLSVAGDDIEVADGMLRIAFTNVPYYVHGKAHIDSHGVHFDDIAVRDRSDGTGVVSGGISYDHFKDMRMDTRLRLDNIECLNTTERDNSSFYGNVFGTGRMTITGPFDALMLDIDATTVKNGRFHIPLNAVGKTGLGDLLVFKEPERHVYVDPYEQMMNTMDATQKKASDMGVRLRINATPGVEANLEIDKSTGNVLTGRGAGTIALEVRPAKDIFNINGDYTLNSGNYHFSALGIANKDFSILDGSTIKFNGDIMESDLDIDAQYNVKTSLSSLIADTTSVSTRRNVECVLSISDKLKNPQLSFAINVPDLDPTTKSRVESALSTDDKVQKQFIALLVTNNFLPDEQSGIVNNSNILYSNVADIFANQLNNILQKLEIPLDLGLKYQESGSGTSIFDVALSTQLFNNRVSVNGNIGNRQRISSGSEDVVGDLDIEIKMDRSGEVRLNLFSHSADEYTNYLDNSQRNGVGVAYQKEFNSLKEFFRQLGASKEERRSKEIEESSREEEKVSIEIK